ncbi:hypothetical protein ACGGZK_08390 [Agromyces sp. MMS24-K17]|uniref:hypothetical protein n=1 Tax=Agromyces sp. MMS24-K17 TaxID=3372850 RepID=UPI0037553A75
MPDLLPEAQPSRPSLVVTSAGVSIDGVDLAWAEVRHVAVVDERALPPAPRGWLRRATPAAPLRLEFVVDDADAVSVRFARVASAGVRMPRATRSAGAGMRRGVLTVDVDAATGERAILSLLRRVFVEAETHAVPQGWFEASADAERAARAYLTA